MKTLGFVNQKGGVGKSFSAKIVASALAGNSYKKRVLLIDCDEQATCVKLRRRDLMERDEFPYEIAACLPQDLPTIMAGKKDMQVVAKDGYVSQVLDERNYDYAIVDMPGRSQSKDIAGLLASLDYAVIVVNDDDSDTLATLDFLQTINDTQDLRKDYEIEPLPVALMYNKFEMTDIYKETVKFWEQQKKQFGIYPEVLFLSRKETYKIYNDTYTNMLQKLKHNKSLEGLHKEFSQFISKLVTFLNQ
jgi:cellulose biosynthesis protein BcsQ